MAASDEVPRPPLSRGPRTRPWSWAAARMPSARLALGVALVVGLGTAWIAVGKHGSGGPSPMLDPSTARSPRTATTVVRAPPARVEHVVAVPPWVPTAIAATCRARASSPSSVIVDCTPGRGVVRLQYRNFASVVALRAAYAARSARRGGVGPPACARGAAEERSWSAAGAPTVPVGRYHCSLAEDRAEIVWFSEPAAVLGVTTRADADLRSLYQWWTTVPGPSAPSAADR